MKKTVSNFLLMSMILMFALLPYNTTFAKETLAYSSQIDEPVMRTHKTEWRYKIVDGIVYRRKYDLSTNKWIGEWEVAP